MSAVAAAPAPPSAVRSAVWRRPAWVRALSALCACGAVLLCAAWLPLLGVASSQSVVLLGAGAAAVAALGPYVLGPLLAWISRPQRGDLASDLREHLFVTWGLLTAAVVGLSLARGSASALHGRLADTLLASAALPMAVVVGLAGTVVAALFALAAPAALARWRLTGRIDGDAAADVLLVGASWLLMAVVAPAVLVLGSKTAGVAADALLMEWLVAGLAGLCGYAVPRLALSQRPPNHGALWLVLPDKVAQPASEGALLAALTRLWHHGPVIWVVPEAVPIQGEHAGLAQRLGQLQWLHPTREFQLADWPRCAPPAQRWSAMRQREIHPARPLLKAAVQRHAAAGDTVVILSRDADAPAEWARALPGIKVAVGWLDPEVGAAVATPVPVADLSGTDRRRFDACKVLLQRLAPTAQPRDSTSQADRQAPSQESAEQTNADTLAEAVSPAPALRPKVFISYVHEYRGVVDALISSLEAHGMESWFDGRVHAGDDWDATLRRMLEESEAVVAVVGRRSAGRKLPLAEMERSIELGKPLIPVFVDPFDEPLLARRYQAANADSSGRIRYIADCRGTELREVLDSTAQRILVAIERSREGATITPETAATVAAPAAPELVRTLTITAPQPGSLRFVETSEGRHGEWSVLLRMAEIDPLIQALRISPAPDHNAAAALAAMLLPADLERGMTPGSTRLRLTLDAGTAKFPWETLFSALGDGFSPMSVVRRLSGTVAGSRSGQAIGDTALLVSNPQTTGSDAVLGLDGELPHLASAQRECDAVGEVLERSGFDVTRSDRGAAADVMSRLHRHPYRVVMISSRALLEHTTPDGRTVSGIALSNGLMLTEAEFGQLSVAPELVFLNAHFSLDTEASLKRTATLQPLVAGLLKMGVHCVVVAERVLYDPDAASVLAVAFFEALALENATFEEALHLARVQTHARTSRVETWAAYQGWGDAGYRLSSRQQAA